MKKMICPECHQTHFKRAEMIYDSGTRYGVSTGPNYDIHYKNQTYLAQSCSPPVFYVTKPDSTAKIMGFCIYVFILAILFMPIDYLGRHVPDFIYFWNQGSIHLYFLRYWHLYALTALFFVWIGKKVSRRYQAELADYLQQHYYYRQEYKAWQNTWVCMNCGHSIVKDH